MVFKIELAILLSLIFITIIALSYIIFNFKINDLKTSIKIIQIENKSLKNKNKILEKKLDLIYQEKNILFESEQRKNHVKNKFKGLKALICINDNQILIRFRMMLLQMGFEIDIISTAQDLETLLSDYNISYNLIIINNSEYSKNLDIYFEEAKKFDNTLLLINSNSSQYSHIFDDSIADDISSKKLYKIVNSYFKK